MKNPRKTRSRKAKKSQRSYWQGEHFNALGALLNAGIAPVEAVVILRKQYACLAPELVRMTGALKTGQRLSQAFGATQLLGPVELEILSAAEQAGKAVEALKFIGQRFDHRASRLRKVKSKLWLPMATFIVAVIVGFILQVAGKTVSVGSAGLQAVFFVFCFVLVMRMVLSAINRDSIGWVQVLSRFGLKSWFSVAQRSFEHVWLTLLLWQYAAGVDWVTATNRIADLAPIDDFQRKIRIASGALKQGQPLSVALSMSGVSIAQGALLTLRTGEASGNMEQSLQHYLAMEAERLDGAIQTLADWLPRVCYSLALVFAIFNVFLRASV
ncbi:MAG: hypothetical protein COA42_07705 [Alteromonadaceae bacterium]|nr:MAG: hypothetical protein COA42_07705 [Alteromonadaceae bacterium]